MRKILAGVWAIGLFGIAGAALAQESTEAQMDAALKDLSAVYGSPVVRVDQAKAICNEEQYVTECAQIGKRHDLFSGERAKQVDTLLNEMKGDAVEKLKKCEDVSCLVEVANSIAGRLNSQNPTVAKAVELTPQKVKEKRTIVDTAKTLGVDIEECRTMDPDTASIELLRGCARLAKHENVQKYIPQATKDRAEGADAAIALKESLASGQISCGDNTLEGCGNFCLAPSSEAREKGSSAIPEICRQIASKFFGDDGIKELENAYSTVQKTFDTFTDNTKNIAFVTTDGRTLSDPGSIGRYMEDAGSRGDVEAVSRGMDFLVKKGFVTEKDRDFALSMVKKVKERGPVNFGECRTDPSKCADLISEEDRGQFTVMGEVEKIMKTEMGKRGVSDPFLCSSDPSVGQSCMEAARAALPQIELLAKDSPQAQAIVSDIRQKIRFGEAGMEARSRVEQRFKTEGDFSIGDNNFRSINDLESFCRTNPQQCLNETAREGIFSKDVAAERYEHAIENSYNIPRSQDVRGEFRPSDVSFDKEEALRQFKNWLDNPQGPPPQPMGFGQQQYPQYPPDTKYQTQYPRPPIDQNRCAYAMVYQPPCKSGEYRQESVNELGCRVLGACIPFDTKTEPPRPDGKNICPALPTVESCPAGETKEVSFSSPECGTYYSCRSSNVVQPPPIQTISCERYGSGWRSVDSSGNCFSQSMAEYRTVNGTLYTCSAVPAYGCSASDIPPTPYPVPSGQKEQVWNNQGLRSWVRSDADQSRIESLKQACANVGPNANVWMPGAGTQSSPDFGMPDPAKCANVTSTTQNDTTTGGMQKCFYPNASKDGRYPGYTVWCEADYYNCHEGSPSGASISTSGLQLGAPSSCESGWSGGVNTATPNITIGSECRSQSSQSACSSVSGCYWYTGYSGNYCDSSGSAAGSGSCPSDQYWNGYSCQSNTQTNTTSGSCSSELIGLLGSGCHSMGSGWFNSEMTRYVTSSNSQTVRSCTTEPISGCSGGNYTQPTSCSSGQYWNGSSCVTSTTQQPSTSCGSGQYWNGSACVTTSTSDTPYSTESAQQGCSNVGGTWDSSSNYCRMPSESTYTAPAYTPPPDSTYTPPPTESYTPPPESTYTPPPTESSPPPTTSEPISYVFCPDGHDWNGAYCTLSPRSPFERYTANVWSAFRALIGI